jgi:hypothetical protein
LPNLSAGISQGVRLIIAMQKQGRQLLNRTFYKPNTNLYSVLKSLIFIMEFQFHYSLGVLPFKESIYIFFLGLSSDDLCNWELSRNLPGYTSVP